MKSSFGRPNPPRLNDTNAISTRQIPQDCHIDLNEYPFALKDARWRRWQDGTFAPKPADRDGGLKSTVEYLNTICGDYGSKGRC